MFIKVYATNAGMKKNQHMMDSKENQRYSVYIFGN